MIANPITMEVNVGYDHDDGRVGSYKYGRQLCHHHGRHHMLCHSVRGRVASTPWPFPQLQPSVSFCEMYKMLCVAALSIHLIYI